MRFRAVTPRRFWDAETPIGVEDIVFGAWFPDEMTVTDVQLLERDPVTHTGKFAYRLSVDTPVGTDGGRAGRLLPGHRGPDVRRTARLQWVPPRLRPPCGPSMVEA